MHLAGSTLISTIGTVTTGSLEGNTSIDTSGELKTTNKVTAGSLAVDNVLVDGSTIGHSANASLMTLSGTKVIVDGGIEVNSITLGSNQ